MSNIKGLFFDIETSPILGWAYQPYDTNLIKRERDWHMMSWSAEWFDGKTITRALSDYPLYKYDKFNDHDLVEELWHLFNEADIIIGHNGDKFDIRKTKARMIFHGFPPPSPNDTVDTLKVARKHFAFTSNKLEDLAIYLGVGEKTEERHSGLWYPCLMEDKGAWKKMKIYNRRDVVLLKGIYEKMKAWMPNHPRIGDPGRCPTCDGELVKDGHRYTMTGWCQRYWCKSCNTYRRGKHEKLTHIR